MDARVTLSDLACTVALLGMLTGSMPLMAQQSSSTSQRVSTSQSATEAQNLPDSPGAVRSNSADEKDSIALLEQAQNEPVSESAPQNVSPQKPVGTAAAEASNVNAIAASQPAGVAIAPAKQRRVRTIILKTGAIIGAGVAIGAVVALTAATPPKPPGAH
jgi:hypothetical protein